MHQSYSTAMIRPEQSQAYWHEVIGSTYFPLSLTFRNPERFAGQLTAWKMGELALSRLASDPLCYRRERRHLAGGDGEDFLVTIPERREVFFSQRGHAVRCAPGEFLLERSDEPYEFSYDRSNLLWVIKVPGQAIRQRIGSPDRFCARNLEAAAGSGALFVGYARLLAERLPQLSEPERQILSQQLLDLLAMALEAGQKLPQSRETAVQAAHLQRIQHYIRTRLGDAELSPQQIAAACGLSPRYLHTLFKSTGRTVCQWIKEQRLQACHDTLSRAGTPESIAQIAYRWGFSDQAHFCRAFKQAYGCSPSELRARSRH